MAKTTIGRGRFEDFPQSRVVVVNRWGQRVFETQGGLERWDGRFSGQRLPMADYYYTIELNLNPTRPRRGDHQILSKMKST